MTGLAKVLSLVVASAMPAVSSAQPSPSLREFSARCAVFYAHEYGIQAELVNAVIQVESGWNPRAVSKKGAAGLMQLMPLTATRFGVQDPFDIEQNIHAGVAYLAFLIDLFKGDLRLAVAAYQVGESWILLRGLAYSSPEVFDYVTRVAQLYRMMRWENLQNDARYESRLGTRGGS
jgi:soluble lytic murein transglycosylase-like protein